MSGRGRRKTGYQTNAADPGAVKAAARAEREGSRVETNDMLEVLALPAGRRVLWRILEDCGVYKSIWDPSVRMHYAAGKQDIGHQVLASIAAADDDAILTMMMEAKARSRRAADTADAQAIDLERAQGAALTEDQPTH